MSPPHLAGRAFQGVGLTLPMPGDSFRHVEARPATPRVRAGAVPLAQESGRAPPAPRRPSWSRTLDDPVLQPCRPHVVVLWSVR